MAPLFCTQSRDMGVQAVYSVGAVSCYLGPVLDCSMVTKLHPHRSSSARHEAAAMTINIFFWILSSTNSTGTTPDPKFSLHTLRNLLTIHTILGSFKSLQASLRLESRTSFILGCRQAWKWHDCPERAWATQLTELFWVGCGTHHWCYGKRCCRYSPR